MKTQHIVAAVVAAVAVVVLLVFLRSSPSEDAGAPVASAPSKAASPAPLSAVAAPAIEKPDEAGKMEIEKLWPHLKQAQPTDADREKVKAEWKSFAVKYPNNIYLPNEFKPALTEAEQKAAQKQLDDVTAVAASNAAMKAAGKSAEPPGAGGAKSGPPAITEQEARAKGITPEQQRVFFNYKIQELESRIQLGEFYLSSSSGDAATKSAMQKEMTQWKKELEELNRVKASIPKS